MSIFHFITAHWWLFPLLGILDSKTTANANTATETGGGVGLSGNNSSGATQYAQLVHGSKNIAARDNGVVISAGRDLISGTQYSNKGDVIIQGTSPEYQQAILQKLSDIASTPIPAASTAYPVDAAQIGNQNFVNDLLSSVTARASQQITNPPALGAAAYIKPALIALGLGVAAFLGWVFLKQK
jgi:hypothetical protein